MITSFQHKGLKLFYETGKTSGINPQHAAKLRLILTAINRARQPEELNIPGFYMHALKGAYKGFWSIRVSGNWRIIFRFDGEDIELVDYLDYH